MVLVLIIGTHLSLWRMYARGVVPVAPWHQIYVVRRHITSAGQPWGWPVLPWTMNSHLKYFFLYGEEEADKICSGSCGWACSGRVEGILDNGELAILEEERAFVGVVAAPEVPPWPEEKEESDPG